MSDTRSCARCKYSKPIAARGLCDWCWTRSDRDGTLIDYERKSRPLDEVLDEWSRLRPEGYTITQAAERLGMNRNTFETALFRGRRAGDSRALRPIGAKAARRPARIRTYDEFMNEFAALYSEGLTQRQIADRMGLLSLTSISRNLARARANNDPRASPPVYAPPRPAPRHLEHRTAA